MEIKKMEMSWKQEKVTGKKRRLKIKRKRRKKEMTRMAVKEK